MNMLRLPPPHWWEPGLTEEGERWSAAYYSGQLPDPWEAAGLRPVKDSIDRVFLDDTGRIWILAGREEWYSKIRPKPFILGERHTLYEIAMMLDDRHPYSVLFSRGAGIDVEDDRREDLRREAIALSDKPQKIYDTIIKACRDRDGRIKRVPTSWSEPADDTLFFFKITDILEIALC
jgi:hypothetical protein